MSCIQWDGYIQPNGYGSLKVNGRNVMAHRQVFFTFNGWWPSVVRHTCDNPGCVNPAHLLGGTQADNMKDMVSRGRVARGERQWRAKLTGKQVREIRKDPRTQREIAKEHGVSQNVISNIKSGKAWAHVV